MQKFFFEGVDARGRKVRGTEEASDRESLLVSLSAKGVHVLRWSERPLGWDGLSFLRKNRLSARQRLEFISELAHLVRSGVPIDRCLQILADATTAERVRQLALTLREGIRGGQSFSQAVAQKAPEFGELTVSMIRVGEAGGVLDEALEKLAGFLARTEEIKRFIISSSIYPVVLLLVGIASVSAILGFVIPKFAAILEDLGPNIPAATRALIALSGVFRTFWWLLALVPVCLALGITAYAKKHENRRRLHAVLLKLPFLGRLVLEVELARMTRTLGTLLESGVPLLKSLSIAQAVARNVLLKEALQEIHEKVQQGVAMSTLMRASPIFPPKVVHMTSIGEETGDLGRVLGSVADSLEKEIQNKTKAALALLEPVVIVFMGILIGGMVISMLLAIFGIHEISF
ncbi:type II secretion system F family protein [Desulfosoma caldarium]|uniref:Type II secretion system protein F (GspF) n=1 Tax=Desulfosoma caldarium TaxID=610254 RepID=A0A3N1VMF3_9BACT|nr:type II secretion system F family protein [Desulfosoma caldarium]ROR03140.1 type II secretion system protein F (GspF) [Desulfosoma caldarium]